jgi:hypothetical protein
MRRLRDGILSQGDRIMISGASGACVETGVGVENGQAGLEGWDRPRGYFVGV